MPHFVNDGLSLYYEVHGSGAPVVMLHGGAVTFAGNFGVCGWIERMNAAGLQVVGLDARGHRGSEVSPDGTGLDVLARDVVALLDHLGIERSAVVGYSAGSAVALHALHTYPSRFTGGALVVTWTSPAPITSRWRSTKRSSVRSPDSSRDRAERR